MKSPQQILFITALILLSQLLFISCSIQQRKYMPGFYIERHTGIEEASAIISQKPESPKHLMEDGEDSQISLTIPAKQKSEEPTASVNSRKQVFLKKPVAENKKTESLFEKKEIHGKHIFRKENTIDKQNKLEPKDPALFSTLGFFASLLGIAVLITGLIMYSSLLLWGVFVVFVIAYLLLNLGIIFGGIFFRRIKKEDNSFEDKLDRVIAIIGITLSIIFLTVGILLSTYLGIIVGLLFAPDLLGLVLTMFVVSASGFVASLIFLSLAWRR